MKRKILAFDLDGVIVDKPPIIPKQLLERLFKGSRNKGLHYRYPKHEWEIWIRKISHIFFFRPPIETNTTLVKRLSRSKKHKLYIISARYSFLKKETKLWLEKRGLKSLFRKIYLNLENEQPHLFKERILKKIKADVYVDDDPEIADYLSERLKIRVFCFSKYKSHCRVAKMVDNLDEMVR